MQSFGDHPLVVVPEETIHFTVEGSGKVYFLAKVLKFYPMLDLLNHGLRVEDCKGAVGEFWNKIARRWTNIPIREKRNAISYFLKRYSFLKVFFNRAELVDCNWRHSFSQYKIFVTCWSAHIKFNPSVPLTLDGESVQLRLALTLYRVWENNGLQNCHWRW